MVNIFIKDDRMIDKYNRTGVRINDAFIDSIMKWITPRDIEILRLLGTHPFLTTDQIEMMIFNNLSPSSWRNKANERIRKLYKAHCLDRFFPSVGENMGSSQQHLLLDYAGFKVVQRVEGRKGDKFRKRNYIPQDYKHMLKIYDFEALLHVLNRQLGFTDEGTIGEILQWRTEVSYKFIHAQDGKARKHHIIPDAFCIYADEPLGYPKTFYLEVDNSTEPLGTLKGKIINYIRFYNSQVWKEERWYRIVRRFPTVCFLFHEQEKVDELVRYTKRLKSNIRFLFSTYDKLYVDKSKLYESKGGKKRLVLQERKVNILDEIWETKNGLESL